MAHRILGLIIGLILIVTCAPNEANFNSAMPATNGGAYCGANGLQGSESPQASKSGANCGESNSVVPQSAPRESAAAGETAPQSEINWNVPFFPQAPDGNWDLPWQEACEEASAILAYHFASGTTLTREQFKKELNALFEWEDRNFGSYKDTTIDQTAQMIGGFWGFDRLRIIEDPTVEQIKAELAIGNPVIAPFAGRELKNPYYSNEGPYYHNLVIKGYDSKSFITNDVGTRRGKNYRYPFDRLMSAMHDWNAADIRLGAKKVIVLGKGL